MQPSTESIETLIDYLSCRAAWDPKIRVFLQNIDPHHENVYLTMNKLGVVLGMLYASDLMTRGHGRHVMNKFWADDLTNLDCSGDTLYESPSHDRR